MRTVSIVMLALALAACGGREKNDSGGAAPATPSSEAPAGEWIRLPSGVKIQDPTVGTGDEAKKGSTVTCHATGWLAANAYVVPFWSSKNEKNSEDEEKTYDFPLRTGIGGVIPGWVEGIPGMRVGGKRRIWIPSELGYGKRGFPSMKIPPDADLIFEVELIAVK